jgi:hypothetical protein
MNRKKHASYFSVCLFAVMLASTGVLVATAQEQPATPSAPISTVVVG